MLWCCLCNRNLKGSGLKFKINKELKKERQRQLEEALAKQQKRKNSDAEESMEEEDPLMDKAKMSEVSRPDERKTSEKEEHDD